MKTPRSIKSKKIFIVGGGFGGVRAARKACRIPHAEVFLISDSDSFTYYPQLYHAATGGSRSETALPLTDLFDGLPITVIHDSAIELDHAKRTLKTQKHTYVYDELILSLGSIPNYFGITGLPQYSFEIQSNAHAEAFKRHLHQQLIDTNTTDINYAIVGGGPTGVELAGALGEYLERIIALHKIPRTNYKIELIEATPRILPRLPERLAKKVHDRLEQLGVTVMTNAKVEGASPDALTVNGAPLDTHTIVWTAGIANNPFYEHNAAQFKLAKGNRPEVSKHLEAQPHLYVIGDNAHVEYAGLAQSAIRHADYVADDIDRKLHRKTRPAFVPKEGISVIPVGPYWAAVCWHNLRLYGRLGWLLRRAADLIAYRDIERLSAAWRVWLQDFKHEDNCRICAAATQN